MYAGIAIAVILAIVKHKWLGLLEASVVIQIFGDVLSYLRLYALGLAGSLLTSTMIDLASGVPFVIGIFILINLCADLLNGSGVLAIQVEVDLALGKIDELHCQRGLRVNGIGITRKFLRHHVIIKFSGVLTRKPALFDGIIE